MCVPPENSFQMATGPETLGSENWKQGHEMLERKRWSNVDIPAPYQFLFNYMLTIFSGYGTKEN